jgi:hypothetical protein
MASVRPEGIVFGGVYFTCERAIKDKWFERARRYGRTIESRIIGCRYGQRSACA